MLLLVVPPAVGCMLVAFKAAEVYNKILTFPVLHVDTTLLGLL